MSRWLCNGNVNKSVSLIVLFNYAIVCQYKTCIEYPSVVYCIRAIHAVFSIDLGLYIYLAELYIYLDNNTKLITLN